MEKKQNLIIHEWRALGISAYLPFLIQILLILYCSLFRDDEIIFNSLQAVIPVLSAWWIIICFYDLVEEDGNEVFFSYPMNRYWIGIGRVFLFYIIYMIISYIIILLCGVNNLNVLVIFIQLGIQSFFYVCLGFFLVSATRKTGLSVGIIISYCVFQILTKGKPLWFINIYTFDKTPLSLITLLSKGFFIIILSLILLVIGQIFILKNLTFNNYAI